MKPEPRGANEIVGSFFPRLMETLQLRSTIRTAVEQEAKASATTCPECGSLLRVNVEATARARVEGDGRLIFSDCTECDERARLRGRGVPDAYAGCSFDTWRTETQEDGKALETAMRYAAKPKGVLILSGSMGRGKTHLATAIFRTRKTGIWTDQPSALAALRAEYGSGNAASVALRLGNTALLVWDDFGLGTGARDEGAFVESVFYRRHANRLPSVVTTNLPAKDFAEAMGPRLAERMREQFFGWVTLSGASRRNGATPKTGA